MPRKVLKGDAPVWINHKRRAIRAQLGEPDWTSDGMDAWLDQGVAVWFDGNDKVREVAFGNSFASPVRPAPFFRGRVAGLRIGDPLSVLDRVAQGRQKRIHQSEDTDQYILPLDTKKLTLLVEVWSQDYS